MSTQQKQIGGRNGSRLRRSQDEVVSYGCSLTCLGVREARMYARASLKARVFLLARPGDHPPCPLSTSRSSLPTTPHYNCPALLDSSATDKCARHMDKALAPRSLLPCSTLPTGAESRSVDCMGGPLAGPPGKQPCFALLRIKMLPAMTPKVASTPLSSLLLHSVFVLVDIPLVCSERLAISF